jgi:hypothetical protein
LARSNLVDARGLQFAKEHEGVWLFWDRVFVRRIGVEVGPFRNQVSLKYFEGSIWGEFLKVNV